MNEKRLLSYIRKAVSKYDMIQENDKIAVGISGGKDSLALLWGLAKLRKFYPNKFDIVAITVNVGFDNMDFTEIKKFCEDLKIDYHIIDTEIKEIVFDIRKEKNPCSLCAKMRKGAFNEKAKELNCNKIAYAHNMDDVSETLMMSLIYEGRINCFEPVTYLDRMDLTLIRPLLFSPEKDVKGFANKYNLPVVKSTCPADGNTKREYTKNLLHAINTDAPGVIERISNAAFDLYKEGE